MKSIKAEGHDKKMHTDDGHDHHDHSSHENENLYGVFLHILADALGSVAVIISSLAIDWGGYYIADPICCLLISILILASVVPLIKSTYKVLSLNQSGKLVKAIEKRLPLVPLP